MPRPSSRCRDGPSGLGWRPDGAMLIVSMTDRRLMRFADGKLSVEAELKLARRRVIATT